MGTQTTVVMLAFVALHVALVLYIVSLSTSYWVEGELGANYTSGNDSDVRKGLWVYCEGDHCHRLNSTIQADWFQATQALFVVGTGGTLAAVVLYYIFLNVATFRTSFKFYAFITLVQLVSTCVLLAGVAIFGSRGKKDTKDFGEDYDFEFGWSFYVAVGGLVAAVIALVSSCRQCCYLRSTRAAYENI